jgi:polysaccharide biosynthesis transport protein
MHKEVERSSYGAETVYYPTPPIPVHPIISAYRSIRKRIKYITAFTLIVLSLTFIIVRQIENSYTATALLTLNAPKVNVAIGTMLSDQAPDLSAIQTHIDVLRSQSLADKVVDKLRLIDDPEFNHSLQTQSKYLTTITKWIDIYGKSGAASDMNTLSKDKTAGGNPSADLTSVKTQVIQEVLSRLSVTNDRSSYTIRVSFTSHDPVKAAAIANAFVEASFNAQLDSKFEATRRATSWLTQRLSALRENVRQSEADLENYKNQINVSELGGQSVTEQQIAQVNTQLITARADRVGAEARLKQTQRLRAAGDVDQSPEIMASPSIQRLRDEETTLVRKAGELSQQYGEVHPKMIALRADLRDLRTKIDSEIAKVVASLQSDVDIARARESALEEQLTLLQRHYSSSSQAEVKLDELRREADTDRDVLNTYLQRLKETSGQDQLQQPDATLASSARAPIEPSSPPRLVICALATIWAAASSIGLSLLADYLSQTFTTEEQLSEIAGVPSLGIVPEMPRKQKRTYLGDLLRGQNNYAEAIRSIKTALTITHPWTQSGVWMITSAVSGEGKTNLAVSLAINAALSGQRVVLVDADMRRPSVLKLLPMHPEKHLVDVAEGNLDVQEALTWLEDSNLAILPTTVSRVSPLDLLKNRSTQTMIQQLRASFDLVIMDTPPVQAVSDALVLAKYVDAVIFAVRWKSTRTDVVRSALLELQKVDAPLIGSVLTRVELKKYLTYGYRDRAYHYALGTYS